MSDRFTATATGRSPVDHVCWPYHGTDDLVASARGYVGEGVDRHEQVSSCTVGFTDHCGLRALDRAARALGTPIHLDRAPPMTAWLLGVLGLSGVDLAVAS